MQNSTIISTRQLQTELQGKDFLQNYGTDIYLHFLQIKNEGIRAHAYL